jgi:excisionase family DNA binding protein
MAHSLLLEQAAELLGVSRRTLYYRIREGRLRTIRARCGSQRVLIESIEELLREQAVRARKRSAGNGAAACCASGAALTAACGGCGDAVP